VELSIRPARQKEETRVVTMRVPEGTPPGDVTVRACNGADTDNTLWHQPEGAGLEAIAEGFRHLGFKDDHEINAAEWIVYDALYAYCQEMVRQGKLDGMFSREP